MTQQIHRDDEGSKLGMWLFIFNELLFFGGLFITYAVFRYVHQEAFHFAAQELDVWLGAANTVILLVSSATIAMSISTIKMGNKKLTLAFLAITLLLAVVFLVNKYFEWGAKIEHGLFPSSAMLAELGAGDTMFYGLYFAMTGLHALHILVGIVLIGIVLLRVKNNKTTKDNHQIQENVGLYWHLVDIIWVFLFPLFYLIA
ncbi:MAG TPA: cytochrome C oxidase subunit III [Bacteroidales bacterium]|jgi:cytochrome c oxidase subunit 3|nr:cytochrome C oxidase subunit III [Bacteroidales bacterium]